MRKVVTFIRDYLEAISAILIVLAIFLFVGYRMSQTKKNGVITIAKAVRFEGAESGVNLYLDIYLEGNIYHTSIDEICHPSCVGKFFFVKVLKDDPTKYLEFYSDKPVPECILKKVNYFTGWTEIPSCDQY